MHDAKSSSRHPMDNEWMNRGSCRREPPSTFFPSDGTGIIVAQRICEDCPVKVECLEHALVHRIDHGVWGGASERQRRRLLKSRRIDVVAESSRATAVA